MRYFPQSKIFPMEIVCKDFPPKFLVQNIFIKRKFHYKFIFILHLKIIRLAKYFKEVLGAGFNHQIFPNES
jgi:hypothetical protein